MSTRLLYHGFGIRGYEYVCTAYELGCLSCTVRQDPKKLTCFSCDFRRVIRRGQVRRRFRTSPIGLKPVWIWLPIGHVFCLACGLVRQVKAGFVDPRRTYIKTF